MPPKKRGPKLNMSVPPTPEPPKVPANLDHRATITIDNEQFEIEADDLEVICELGRYISSSLEMN